MLYDILCYDILIPDTPDGYALRLHSCPAAKLIGFNASKCVCLPWTHMRHISTPLQLRRSGAFRRKYTELLVLPDAGAQFSTEHVAWEGKSATERK